MIIKHDLISFDTDRCYFAFNEDEYQIARFLRGAYNENKPRFQKRFLDFFNAQFKALDFEYFSNILNNIEKCWDIVTPFSYKEAFELKGQQFRALVFSSINVSEMIKELGATRVNTEGKELINKTWNKYLNKFEEVPYSVVYELYHVNGEKLGIESSSLPIVKCWCTTTDSEHWLWVDNSSFSNNSPLEAIASTCVIYKSMEGKIKHIIRQGDVFLFEMTEDVMPSESEELITLPMNQYFSLLKSQA
jgi:hypothetical protein